MLENIYSWEFEDRKNRWTLWYTIALSIVIWISIWWFFTKQYSLSFIVLLISWLVYFVENNSEDKIKVIVSNLWIKVSNSFYDYKSINNYSIVYKSEEAILIRLHLNRKWLRFLDIKIDNNIISELKPILTDYIEEWEKTELTLSEKFTNLLKL
jgi:hypothetical protein